MASKRTGAPGYRVRLDREAVDVLLRLIDPPETGREARLSVGDHAALRRARVALTRGEPCLVEVGGGE